MRFYIYLFIVCIGIFSTQTALSSVNQSEMAGPEFVDPNLVPKNIVNATQKLVDAYNSGDEKALAELIDFEAIGKSAAKGLFNSVSEERAFAKGVASGESNIIKLYIDQVKKSDGYVIFLGYIKRKGTIFPQIRFDLGDLGTDYHELVIETNLAGQTYIIDWYQISTDQTVSETLGIVGKLVTQPNSNLLKKLFGIVEIDKSVVKSFKALGDARRTGNYSKANKIFESLPKHLRNSKIMLGVGIGLAGSMDDDDLYRSRLSDLAKFHGDDPSSAFLLIDHFFYEGDLEKALKNIRIIEGRIGKDGFTTYIKGNLYYSLANDTRRAIALYKDAINIEPSYEASYQTLSALYIEDLNYKEAVKVLILLEKQFSVQYRPDDFFDTQENELFKKSIEYKNWMGPRIQ